jgi:hypothetical protein
MDEKETVKHDEEELEHLEEEIQAARRRLDEETHEKEKNEQTFYGENEGPVPG